MFLAWLKAMGQANCVAHKPDNSERATIHVALTIPSKLNAPWISSLNLRAKTSTTDEENLDAMVWDEGKACEMPEDVHGGSHR